MKVEQLSLYQDNGGGATFSEDGRHRYARDGGVGSQVERMPGGSALGRAEAKHRHAMIGARRSVWRGARRLRLGRKRSSRRSVEGDINGCERLCSRCASCRQATENIRYAIESMLVALDYVEEGKLDAARSLLSFETDPQGAIMATVVDDLGLPREEKT